MPHTYFKLLYLCDCRSAHGANVFILPTLYCICLLQWFNIGFRKVDFCLIVLSVLLEPLHILFRCPLFSVNSN